MFCFKIISRPKFEKYFDAVAPPQRTSARGSDLPSDSPRISGGRSDIAFGSAPLPLGNLIYPLNLPHTSFQPFDLPLDSVALLLEVLIYPLSLI